MTEQRNHYARYPFIRGNQALWRSNVSEKGARFRQVVITSDEWAWNNGRCQVYALEGTGRGIIKGKLSTEPNPKVLFDGDFRTLDEAGKKFDEIVSQAQALGFKPVTLLDELEFQVKIRESAERDT